MSNKPEGRADIVIFDPKKTLACAAHGELGCTICCAAIRMDALMAVVAEGPPKNVC